MRALVVDDDSTNRIIHQTLLRKLGVKSLEMVVNGKEALDIHSSGQTFDLILMDMDMPIMNGIQATKELRAMGVRSMIAGISTRAEGEAIQEFINAGLDDYQEKPLTSSKLKSILHKISHLMDN
ncbi:hypothetical protein K2173_025710 [Erythroxylum novogranatense]|uniref:Response regulatory domain-containing protein n=1 Tax=Erythroxylum novogranatense TaxID=1862640 RepID=A0AAV8SBG1_9ROSI|nr:hypothetical protein K2173_025710 [Erythroxylum novogranatense]